MIKTKTNNRNNFAHASHFLVHFCAVTAHYDVKSAFNCNFAKSCYLPKVAGSSSTFCSKICTCCAFPAACFSDFLAAMLYLSCRVYRRFYNTCVQKCVCVTSYHDIHSINLFGYSFVYVYTRVTNGDDFIDVLLLQFFHSFPH